MAWWGRRAVAALHAGYPIVRFVENETPAETFFSVGITCGPL